MPGDEPGRSLQRCATCPARNGEVTSSGDEHSQGSDREQSVRSCGELLLSDVFTKSGTKPELAKVPLFTGEVFHTSLDPDSDDYFGGDIEASSLIFNVQDGGVGKARHRSINRLLADRYGSPSGEITARVVVATAVSLLWNAGCFLMILYTSLVHSVGKDGDSESSTASPWLVVLLAPLVVIGGVLTISVSLEWQKIYMHRRRSTAPVSVGSHHDAADVENRNVASASPSTSACLERS